MVTPYFPPGVANLIADLREKGRATQQVIGEATHKDAYELVRTVRTETGYGTGTMVEATVETGYGSLDVRNVLTGEAVQSEAIGATSAYTMTLPFATVATPNDTLRVAGRTFGITGVQRGGHFAAFATANLEEKETTP